MGSGGSRHSSSENSYYSGGYYGGGYNRNNTGYRRGGRRPRDPNYSLISRNVHDPNERDEETLRVKGIDLNRYNNSYDHHTNEYDVINTYRALVVRRGQKFEVTVEFNRPYNKGSDDLRIVFQFGKNIHPSEGTHVEFVLSDADKVSEWGGWVKSSSGNSVTLILTASCKAPVGKWKLSIDVVKKSGRGGREVARHKHSGDVYILFNPWCKDDDVYLHDDNLLKEYVLEDKGLIFRGSAKEISQCEWVFGQFEGVVLDCVLYLLDKHMRSEERGDPVSVVRCISSVMNSSDNRGILEGNWSGEYGGGTKPTSWIGSEAIINEYYKNKRPVKYGQCWVFSGIVTTVCRTLGIAARCVTNFSSAHDTDGSTSIDRYYALRDGKYQPVEARDTDSVWNFHVWNDVWMTRPELPAGYGGWQAIDATPQERSDGIYACGPMSLQAIRKGEIHHKFDGAFIFAEVNGDKITWIIEPDGTEIPYHRDPYAVGKCISTKKPLSDDREDLTNVYKFPDGSDEERAAVRRAKQRADEDLEIYSQPTDVEFKVFVKPNTHLGDDIEVRLQIKNTSGQTMTVSGTMTVASMYYTGVYFKDIKKEQLSDRQIQSKKEEVLDMYINPRVYMTNLTDHCYCNVYTVFSVKETGQVFINTTEFRLRKPHLTVKGPSSVRVGEKFTIEVSFKNPLDMTLKSCDLTLEGPGIQRNKLIKQSNVGALDTFKTTVDLTPAKQGNREVVVYFNCDQIYAVTGKLKVQVSK